MRGNSIRLEDSEGGSGLRIGTVDSLIGLDILRRHGLGTRKQEGLFGRENSEVERSALRVVTVSRDELGLEQNACIEVGCTGLPVQRNQRTGWAFHEYRERGRVEYRSTSSR